MRTVSSVELLPLKGPSEPPFETASHRIGAAASPCETAIHRIGGSAHFREDSVFVAGGLGDAPGPEGDVRERSFRPGVPARTWPLQNPRYLHAAVATTPAQILLIAGLTASKDSLCPTSAVERIDLEKATSERLPDLPYMAAEPSAILLPDGRILVAGGYDDEVLRHTALLDMASGTWQSYVPLPSPRAISAPLFLSGHVLLLGGATDFGMAPATSILIHDLEAASWSEHPLEIPSGAAITALGTDTFLVAGGRTKEGGPLADVTLWTATLAENRP